MTKSVKQPKYETRVVKRAYTQKQYDIAYTYAKEREDGLSLMLLLEIGVSRSELLGLCWEDIDTENQSIHMQLKIFFSPPALQPDGNWNEGTIPSHLQLLTYYREGCILLNPD